MYIIFSLKRNSKKFKQKREIFSLKRTSLEFPLESLFLFILNIPFFILVSMQFWRKGTRILCKKLRRCSPCNSQHSISLAQRFNEGTIEKVTQIGPRIGLVFVGIYAASVASLHNPREPIPIDGIKFHRALLSALYLYCVTCSFPVQASGCCRARRDRRWWIFICRGWRGKKRGYAAAR